MGESMYLIFPLFFSFFFLYMYVNHLPRLPSCSLYSAEGFLRTCALEMIVLILIVLFSSRVHDNDSFDDIKGSYAVVVERFYIALFSVLEQIHCAFVACDSK